MSYDPDALLDRRRLKRRLRIWQGVTLFVGLAAVLVFLQSEGELFREDRIARVYVEGIIVRDDARSQVLARLAADKVCAESLSISTVPGAALSAAKTSIMVCAISPTKSP